MEDLQTMLGAVSGDEAFARQFFSSYIEGREVPDYERLLARAGILLRPAAPGRATAGAFRLQDGPNGARVATAVPFDSPAWRAGLDRDDVLVSIGSTKPVSAADFARAVDARKPGDALPVSFMRRGELVSAVLNLVEDPRVVAVPAEEAGQPLSDAQKTFRDGWLRSRAKE
jgi:predicted metalloprotease with PDZ domain